MLNSATTKPHVSGPKTSDAANALWDITETCVTKVGNVISPHVPRVVLLSSWDQPPEKYMCLFITMPFTGAQITVMCGRDYISMRAVEDFFKYYKVPLESLHLPNKTCRVQKEVIDGVSYYMSSISKEKYLRCGGRPLEVQSTFYTSTEIHFMQRFTFTELISLVQ